MNFYGKGKHRFSPQSTRFQLFRSTLIQISKHSTEDIFKMLEFLVDNIFVGVFICPSSDGTYYGMVMSPSVSHSYSHFSPTCFGILSWDFVLDFILMHVWSSSINFRKYLQESCPFLTLNYCKYAVFSTFLQHASTYWVEILYMNSLFMNQEHRSGVFDLR